MNTTLPQSGEVLKTNGTVAGTQVLKEVVPGATGSNPRHLKFWNGKLYFQANDQIWCSDGTEAGTTWLDTGSTITDAGPFAPAESYLYFGAVNAGVRGLYRSNGNIGHVEFLGTHPSQTFLGLGGQKCPQAARHSASFVCAYSALINAAPAV